MPDLPERQSAGPARCTGSNSKDNHYLSGAVRCERCGSRLIYGAVRGGAGGRHDCFTCPNRLTGWTLCDLPNLPAERLKPKSSGQADRQDQGRADQVG